MSHQGELTVQRRAGVHAEQWGSAGVTAAVPPVAAEFLARQRMIVVGAAAEDGAVWASALAGPEGFVTAEDDRTVTVDGLPESDDPLAGIFGRTAGGERDIGMLAIEPPTRRRMRINGRVRRDGERLVIRTEQVYANCPKYLQSRSIDERTPHLRRGPAHAVERLTAAQREWIGEADTFFIATRAPGLGADASHRGGGPGFVTVSGDRRLTWPDYTGNSMYMTFGNLELDPRCGLLFLDWEHGHALHLTGRARLDWDERRAASVPGAQRLIDFDLEHAVQIDGALPLRWTFEGYSRFNPS